MQRSALVTGSTALLLGTVLLSPAPLAAQLMASELGSVSQVVDGTRMEVRYSRPRVRGRTNVIGSRVKWGEVWTPGANAATTLALSKDVTLEGTPVKAGKYSVWMIPARTGEWELVLDPDTTLFHTQGPKAREGQVRLPVRAERGDFTEVLTWSFPEVGATGATLAMRWDTVAVPLRIRVTPTYETTVSADAAAPLVGRYRMRLIFPEPPGGADAAGTEGERPPSEVTLDVHHDEGELRATMSPPMFSTEEGYAEWSFLPRRPGYWSFGRRHQGELVEVMDFITFRFTTEGGRVTGFEARAPDDTKLAEGTRIP